jgi:general secretion pathway protein C
LIDLLKKYFWALDLIIVGTCGYFAARASLNVVEGMFLLEDADGKKPTTLRRSTPSSAPRLAPDKRTDDILRRNVFCSECPPIVPMEPKAGPDTKEGQEVRTSLPLQLIATLVSSDPAWSFAVIKDTQGREAEDSKGQRIKIFPFAMYAKGNRIDGHDAVVDAVEERRVYLKVANHREYADLVGVAGAEKLARAPVTTAATAGAPAAGDLQKGVRKVSETQYEIDRNLLEKVLSDTNALARSARVVPSVSPKDGKPNGFKLYAIRPGSVYATIGLQNGDTISAVNGQELNAPEKAFELLGKLRSASQLQISIVRRGQPMNVDYSIR